MSVKEREEVFDLDFTYGEEFVHLSNGSGPYCGAKVPPRHRSHHPGYYFSDPAPSHCPCGAPVCPVCAHEHNVRGGRI